MYDFAKQIIKNINYPVAMKLLGRGDRVASFEQFKRKQYEDPDIIRREQEKKLFDMVDYAIRHVPYYREYASRNNLSISEDTICEDIKKFPILTKEIIRKEGHRLYSDENIEFIYNTSGGSTGEPVRLRQDKSRESYREYFFSFASYDIGDKELDLWGSERDILAGSVGIKNKLANRFIYRRRICNSFLMDEDDMRRYVKTINEFKPKIILAYVQSIYELARFIRRENLKITPPMGGIIASAGTLFPEWKKYIEDVFSCPVINQYGSRETPAIAISCDRGSKLHINTFLNYVEIVDDDGNNLPEDAEGEIIVTNLSNKSMPMIRYQIGDVGSLSSQSSCDCGRNLPLLNHVNGRTVNIFRRRDGATIDGEYFTHLFYGIDAVKRFQVIQNDYDAIDVHIELNEGDKIDDAAVKQIIANIKLVMGDSCMVNWSYEEDLRPTKSGKFLYTISHVQ